MKVGNTRALPCTMQRFPSPILRLPTPSTRRAFSAFVQRGNSIFKSNDEKGCSPFCLLRPIKRKGDLGEISLPRKQNKNKDNFSARSTGGRRFSKSLLALSPGAGGYILTPTAHSTHLIHIICLIAMRQPRSLPRFNCRESQSILSSLPLTQRTHRSQAEQDR